MQWVLYHEPSVDPSYFLVCRNADGHQKYGAIWFSDPVIAETVRRWKNEWQTTRNLMWATYKRT